MSHEFSLQHFEKKKVESHNGSVRLLVKCSLPTNKCIYNHTFLVNSLYNHNVSSNLKQLSSFDQNNFVYRSRHIKDQVCPSVHSFRFDELVFSFTKQYGKVFTHSLQN